MGYGKTDHTNLVTYIRVTFSSKDINDEIYRQALPVGFGDTCLCLFWAFVLVESVGSLAAHCGSDIDVSLHHKTPHPYRRIETRLSDTVPE